MQSALRMQQIMPQMAKVTRGMDSVLQSMNPEKITRTMDVFEKKMDDLQVVTATMEGGIQQSTGHAGSQDEIESLIAEMSAGAAMDVDAKMADAGQVGTTTNISQEMARTWRMAPGTESTLAP